MSLSDDIHAVPMPRRHMRALVAKVFGIEERRLIGRSRIREVVRARHVAAYCIKKRWPETSYPQIGALLGGRDHSTIIHACRTIEALMERDPALRAVINRLIQGRFAGQHDAHVAAWREHAAARAGAKDATGVRAWSPRYATAVASCVDAVERERKVKPKNALSPDDTDAIRRRSGSDALSDAIAAAGGWR